MTLKNHIHRLRGGTVPAGETPLRGASHAEPVFYVEFQSEGDSIRVRSYEGIAGSHKTLTRYENLDISFKKAEKYAAGITDMLSRANRGGRIGSETLKGLKHAGQLLYDELFPARVKASLASTGIDTLILGMDDRLVFVPWELAFDGKEFLCRRFNMGRVVSTRHEFSTGEREVSRPLRMMILADPQGNLPSSYTEGIQLRDMLDNDAAEVNVSLKSTGISTDYIKGTLRDFDILHYAGHAEYDAEAPSESGLLLEDGRLSAGDIRRMVGRTPFPSLVFSNACHSGRSEHWRVGKGYEDVFGLASSFLLSGVRHYLGTFWEIQDEAGLYFSLYFYRALMEGNIIGEAVRKAREGLIQRYGEESVVWASYMFYGDPTTRYAHGTSLSGQKALHGEAFEQADAVRAIQGEGALTRGGRSNFGIVATIIALAIVAAVYISGSMQGGRTAGGKGPAPEVPEGNRKTAALADVRRGERIDALINELEVRKQKAGDAGRRAADEWTSPPLSMVFLGVRGYQVQDAERDYLIGRLTSSLQNSGRVKMVERAMLDGPLSELKLGASDLADPATALKMGKILSARVIATGSVLKEKGQWMVNLRFIETETTSIRASISEAQKAVDAEAVAASLSGNILERLKTVFPLQGRITSIKGEDVIVNLGSESGMVKGTGMDVLTQDGETVARIECVNVRKADTDGKVLTGRDKITAGMRVRESAAKAPE